jgi:hypothetical protein
MLFLSVDRFDQYLNKAFDWFDFQYLSNSFLNISDENNIVHLATKLEFVTYHTFW